MPTVAESDSREVTRPLRVLVPLIKDAVEHGEAAGLEYYRQAGALLLEAREQVEHREWGGWLQRHFKFSRSTATRWMALAEESQKVRRRTFTRLSDAYAPDARRAHHQPTWHKPVQESVRRVDVDRLAQDQQTRQREQRLLRELAHRLVDIGYKVLATQLHPDKGGSAEAMARLNRVRTILKNAV